MKRKQQGVTFLGMVFVGIVVALVGVVAAQVSPTYLEYQSIMGNTVAEVRRSFDASAAVDYFTAIKGSDLQISKENDKVVVEFAYNKEIHLAGPAYLVMKYAGRTK